MKGYTTIGDIARQAGLSPDSLRHYERLGLIPRPRRLENGYRAYTPETLPRVRVIQAALSVGFTLKELSRILRVRDNGGAPCHEVRSLASTKLSIIEEQISLLQNARKHLKHLIKDWDQILKQSPAGTRAHLLDGLAKQNVASGAKRVYRRLYPNVALAAKRV